MTNVLYPDFNSNFKIKNSAMQEPNFKIVSTKMDVEPLEWKSQKATPIKSKDDIAMISNYLLDRGIRGDEKAIRNNLMFVCGINFGLRCSDLTQLRFGHLLRPDGSVKDTIWIREIKTERKRGANAKTVLESGEIKYKLKDPRKVFVTDSVRQALMFYCAGREIDLNDFLFPGQKDGKPLSYDAVYDIFTKLLSWNRKKKTPGVLASKLSRPVHASTHMLRKTFAYHFIMSAPERNRAVEYLQICMGHSSQLTTLRYAGITDDEIQDVVLNMNLGGEAMDVHTSEILSGKNEINEDDVVYLEVFADDDDEDAC